MLKLHHFYREYEKLPSHQRFNLIESREEPTSLFVIFKRLTEVRAQMRFFEEQEARLLALAEAGFKQLQSDAQEDTEPNTAGA